MESVRWNRIALLILLLLPLLVGAQTRSELEREYRQEEVAESAFEQEAWEQAVQGMDFSEGPEEPEKDEEEEESEPAPSSDWGNFSIPGLDILLYILAIGIPAALLIYFLAPQLLLSNPRVNNSSKSFTIEDLDENVALTELERFLKEALEQKDYRLAIRIHFLMVIKELSEQKHILWKKDKTNLDYLREVEQKPIYNQFFDITRLFERIWYGDLPVEESDYPSLRKAFGQFLSELKPVKA